MISGTQNPVVGKEEIYQVNDAIGLPFLDSNVQYVWHIWKKSKDNKWLDITKDPPKIGRKVTFKFGEKVMGNEFRLEVYKATKKMLTNDWEAKKIAEIIVIPASSKTPKIDRVVLFNQGAKDPNKASYKDTLIARAYCTALFNQPLTFNLWEDDAEGGGHHAAVNKNNLLRTNFTAKVNKNGIAEAKISLMSNASVLKQIANGFNNQEGKTHEYYVTASHDGKIKKASQVNVNVANPDNKQKPKDDSAKFPATTSSKAKKQPDSEGKITNAYFVNDKNQKLSRVPIGYHVKVQILSTGMKDRYIQYVVWEEDNVIAGNIKTHDEIYRSGRIKIDGDIITTGGFTITEKQFNKGIDFPTGDSDSNKQNYFLEIIILGSKANSKNFGLYDGVGQKMEVVKSAAVVKEQNIKPVSNCGEKYCIKKGDKYELIREINIRLAGFGGNVPTDEFTVRTEKMIKQFQRDYMKVPETGKVCGNVLRAIDEFQAKFTVDIDEGKCPCGECTGFGKNLYTEQKNNSKIAEKSRKYEYPGIHRSLLWVKRAIKFYLANHEKSANLKIGLIFSGYRCNANNRKNRRASTNHMGKALDLHIYKLTDRNNTEKNADKVRDLLLKYTKAEYRWGGRNVFALEPSNRNKIGDEFVATTWVHYDVRTFDLEYLKDEYFVKNNSEVNGENMVSLATRLGFQKTCSCNIGAVVDQAKEPANSNKYKWSHSAFGNLIAQEESGNNYNICNQTKGGLKVISNIKVVETSIKVLQKKQVDRDVFAIGRYQLIPDTFNAAINSLKLDGNDNLDKDMQDKIFDEYLIKVKRPKIIAYLEGDGTVEDAMYATAQEWASVGVEKGKRISDKKVKDKNGKVISVIKRYANGGESYYAGDGLNKSHISPEQIKQALINSKNANK